MLAEEGYEDVALDLLGVKTKLDEFEVNRRVIFFLKIEKILVKELKVD